MNLVLLTIAAESGLAAQYLALGLGPVEARLRALNQQIPLELRHGIEDIHSQRARRTGEVNAAKGKAMHTNAYFGQRLS